MKKQRLPTHRAPCPTTFVDGMLLGTACGSMARGLPVGAAWRRAD